MAGRRPEVSVDLVLSILRQLGLKPAGSGGRGQHPTWVDVNGRTLHPDADRKTMSSVAMFSMVREAESKGIFSRDQFKAIYRDARHQKLAGAKSHEVPQPQREEMNMAQQSTQPARIERARPESVSTNVSQATFEIVEVRAWKVQVNESGNIRELGPFGSLKSAREALTEYLMNAS